MPEPTGILSPDGREVWGVQIALWLYDDSMTFAVNPVECTPAAVASKYEKVIRTLAEAIKCPQVQPADNEPESAHTGVFGAADSDGRLFYVMGGVDPDVVERLAFPVTHAVDAHFDGVPFIPGKDLSVWALLCALSNHVHTPAGIEPVDLGPALMFHGYRPKIAKAIEAARKKFPRK